MSEWISVKDTFPLYKQCVLVYLENGITTEAVYRGEYESEMHIFRIELTREATATMVTHWMPLPAPPEKENE